MRARASSPAAERRYGSAAEFPNSNNTIQNNAIKRSRTPPYMIGNAATLDQNWLLTQNDVGSATVAEKLGFRGFFIGNAGNFTISRQHDLRHQLFDRRPPRR